MERPLVHRARELRQEQTDHEAELWQFLRAKRFLGYKFYRQYVIDPYIVDFCCPEKSVVIELDGSWHLEPSRQKRDQKRDQYIQARGYRMLRIWNNDWRENKAAVLEMMAEFIVANVTKAPSP